MSVTHLFVLLHGVGGSRHDLTFLASQISSAFPDSCCHVVVSNEGKTTDGVDYGGARAALEVMALLKTRSFRTLSVVGHSLGGLYGRYMIGILDHLGVFQILFPLVFVSLAAPHLGARSMREQFRVGSAVDFLSRMMGRTTDQIMLNDKLSARCGYHALIAPYETAESKIPFPEPALDATGVQSDSVCVCSWSTPFLVSLAGGPFLRALSQFQCRLTYANLCGDVPVGFETAAIQFTNPSTSLAANYVVDCPLDHSPLPELPVHLSPRREPFPETPISRFSRQLSMKFFSKYQTKDLSTVNVAAPVHSSSSSMNETPTVTAPILQIAPIVAIAESSIPGGEQVVINTVVSPTAAVLPLTQILSPRLGLSDASVYGFVRQIHTNLNTLHWHRVAIRGRPLLAHTDIVVKSETINAKGKQIVADMILKLDRELKRSQSEQAVSFHASTEIKEL